MHIHGFKAWPCLLQPPSTCVCMYAHMHRFQSMCVYVCMYAHIYRSKSMCLCMHIHADSNHGLVPGCRLPRQNRSLLFLFFLPLSFVYFFHFFLAVDYPVKTGPFFFFFWSLFFCFPRPRLLV